MVGAKSFQNGIKIRPEIISFRIIYSEVACSPQFGLLRKFPYIKPEQASSFRTGKPAGFYNHLVQHLLGLPHFLLEVFHGKLVQVRQECLSTLFRILVDLHFSGKRIFTELKKRDISLDFRAAASLEAQMTDRLYRDFDFERYSERIKLLNGVFNPKNEHPEHLLHVAKHVQIRNSFQHRRGVVDDFMLKELGLQKIALLDADGTLRDYQLNDCIQISIPEFDTFRRSLLMVGQLWRKWND